MNALRKNLPPLSSLLPFEATARLGSITKAGEELGLTQAAVSKQIRSLEDDLGMQLFQRRNRALFLTDEGREFRDVVADALGSVGAFARDLRHQSGSGEVVLRAQLCEGLYWLMPKLSKFYQQHPNVEVRVAVSTRPITEAEERFDLALQTTGRDFGAAKPMFSAPDEVFPVCSPGYLERLGFTIDTPLPAETLAHVRLLHHFVQPQDWIDWDAWLESRGMELRVGHRGEVYDSYPMMMQAVIEGHGIALGWRRTTEALLASGTIIRPFQESVHVPDSLTIYHPTGRNLRKDTAILLDWLKGELM